MFVGHGQLQASLHLAAIKLRESGFGPALVDCRGLIQGQPDLEHRGRLTAQRVAVVAHAGCSRWWV